MKRQLTFLLALAMMCSILTPVGLAAPSSDSTVYEKPTLESVDHDAYLHGSGDGYFHPMDQLTRGEAAMLIYNCLSFVPSTSVTFPDVPSNSWYAPAASALGALGIVSRKEPFHGEVLISKGELVSYIMFFFDPRTDAELFPDVWTGHQYADAIRSARAYGFINGDETGKFHPNGTITRAEVATLFNHVLGRSADTASVQQNRPVFYLDVPSTAWYYNDVVEASVSHEYEKSGDKEIWTSFTVPESPLPKDFTTQGFHLYNGYSYYYDATKGDILRKTTLQNTWTFDQNGRQTTGDAEVDAALAKILRSVCTDSMAQAEKLKAVFGYCRDGFPYRKSDVPDANNPYSAKFVLSAAKSMLSKGKGNCYNFASVFFYLARWLGYAPTAYSGTLLGDPHSWVEIPENGTRYIYDTQMAWRWYHDRNRADYMWYFYRFLDTTDYWKYRVQASV